MASSGYLSTLLEVLAEVLLVDSYEIPLRWFLPDPNCPPPAVFFSTLSLCHPPAI